MSKSSSVSFNLVFLKTEQFAIIEKNFQEGKDVNISHQLKFGGEGKNRMLAVLAGFRFEIGKNPFLAIEVRGNFAIEKDAWDSFLQPAGDALQIPKGFMAHLAMLMVGTTRGVLHARTEGTPFNKFVLPTINVAEIIKEDIRVTLTKPTE